MIDINEIKAGRISLTEMVLNEILDIDLTEITAYQSTGTKENIIDIVYDCFTIMQIFDKTAIISINYLEQKYHHGIDDYKPIKQVINGSEYDIWVGVISGFREWYSIDLYGNKVEDLF